MPETRVWRQKDEKGKTLPYYNSAQICIEPAGLTVEKCYKEGEKQFYLLRIKKAGDVISIILDEKQKKVLYKNVEKQRLKGTIQITARKSKDIQRAVPDFFYIKVENVRQYREHDGKNSVKLKGRVTEIKEKKNHFSIKIKVFDQEFPCVIEKGHLLRYGVKVGDYVKTKAYLNTRDFYLDDEVYEDSYMELIISYIEVQ